MPIASHQQMRSMPPSITVSGISAHALNGKYFLLIAQAGLVHHWEAQLGKWRAVAVATVSVCFQWGGGALMAQRGTRLCPHPCALGWQLPAGPRELEL